MMSRTVLAVGGLDQNLSDACRAYGLRIYRAGQKRVF